MGTVCGLIPLNCLSQHKPLKNHQMLSHPYMHQSFQQQLCLKRCVCLVGADENNITQDSKGFLRLYLLIDFFCPSKRAERDLAPEAQTERGGIVRHNIAVKGNLVGSVVWSSGLSLTLPMGPAWRTPFDLSLSSASIPYS